MRDFRLAKDRVCPDRPWITDETNALLAEIQQLYRSLQALPAHGAELSRVPSPAYAALEQQIRVLADRFWKATA